MRRARAGRGRSRWTRWRGWTCSVPSRPVRHRAAPRRRSVRLPAGARRRRLPGRSLRSRVPAPPPPPGPGRRRRRGRRVPASVGTPRASATAPPAGPAALTAAPRRARRVDRQADSRRSVAAASAALAPAPGPRSGDRRGRAAAGDRRGPRVGDHEGTGRRRAGSGQGRARRRPLRTRAGSIPPVPPLRERVELPLPAAAAALVRDRADRIVQVNPALRGLTGRTEAELLGTALAALVVGTGTEALVVGHDAAGPGAPAAVGRPRPGPAGRRPRPPARPRRATRRFTAELERMARVGTWRYELATGTLHRSEPLQEIYGERGGRAGRQRRPRRGRAGRAAGPVAARRCRPARPPRPSWRCPGRRLSCRAEVEFGPDGAPARLIGVVRDVTAQHELEARARHAARRFADLAALVPTGVAIVDPDGVVREVNPALCALLDVVPEQLRGVPGRRPVRRPRVRSGRDRAGRTAAPAAARLAAPGAARRGAPLPGRGRAAAARRRHHRLVRAGRLDDDAATTTAGSGCWPAPTSASSAGRPSCCAARAPSTS